jgi:8-hydroxy-5-deazaflavin:NADPH oxidoreductase
MSVPSVAVLGGTGQQGRGIAQRLALAGLPIVVGSRDPSRAAATIGGWPASVPAVRSAPYGDAIASSDVVVLAIPFDSVDAMLEQHQQSFRQQALVVDVTVPLSFANKAVALAAVPEGSAAEHVKARLPAHTRLAATFKTVPASLLSDLDRPLDCDEFVCGDSDEARAGARDLVQAMPGLRAIDVGPLSRARSIEHLTLLAVGINRRHKIHDARFRIVGL